MIAETESARSRVEAHTADYINERIRQDTEAKICYYSRRLDQIEDRINQLDQEWDIERTLQTNAAAVSMFGIIMGTTRSRKWYLLPAVVAGFLLQHAVQGWCPPLEMFRRLGFRTSQEIYREKNALKALRGDYNDINSNAEMSQDEKAQQALHATEI
ncbi:hypothetical protein STSP2_00848 [Anaerohalosphaera lusitana]|uniref:DUF2892 domain-containing protein n=1 Tax=Anaerohalosphaera lusitana TaxID=1936003 RepID=A0A1U9NJE8_9BACT|nr:DUF2892 domain-containing protein [Anaerohalosphaera lusitana]AQT67700.1 hypothetical protein STSP2_00848 [Anaerohalosphaera lusitana]